MAEMALWLALAATVCGLGKHWLNLWYLWRARKSGGDKSALLFAEAVRRMRLRGVDEVDRSRPDGHDPPDDLSHRRETETDS